MHARGSVGLLLVPHAPSAQLSPPSAAALVRLCLAGDLLGVCAHYGTTGVYLLPRPEVLTQLQPTPQDAAAYVSPQQRDVRMWRPALPFLRGLELDASWSAVSASGGGAATEAAADTGGSGEEVAMFALDGLQRSGRVWPGMQLPLRVFERRYQLLIKACIEQRGRGGGSGGAKAVRSGVGSMFGIVSGGYGTSATVQVGGE